MQPTLHIADKDPIPEEQVKLKSAFCSPKENLFYKAYLPFSVSDMVN